MPDMTFEQLAGYQNLVITQPNCPFCVKAKAILDERGTAYTTLVLGADLAKTTMVDFVEQQTGNTVRTVPQIFLDGSYIGGHDDLVAFLARQVDGDAFGDFEL
ncbi:glutaredoxin domain-containing protein [Photobacterium sp. MCCC 1A19761]|uniref:glutaredoxin domain-containing protein n=1 Tax=Photobacterium sp. MCCC 1A19761 TaxID=3115000 RepID=UPI00307F0956